MRTVQFRFDEDSSDEQLVEFSERARKLAAEMGLEMYDDEAPRAFMVVPRTGIDQSAIVTIKLYRVHANTGLVEAKRSYESGKALFRASNEEEFKSLTDKLRAGGVLESEIRVLSHNELQVHLVHHS